MNQNEITHPELGAVEVDGMSRSSFILKGALAAGAVYGATAVTPFVSGALAAAGSSDVDILNFALTLEYLETDFYTVKGKSVHLSGEAKMLASTIGAEEGEHVAALSKAITSIGGKPVAKPKFKFPVTNQKSFLALAYVLENTGVGAYNGAAPSISNSSLLAAAGSIAALISVGLPESIAALTARFSSSGVVACTPVPPKASIILS